ncbi:hypothetical protein IMSAGC018_01390 [Lachnospiraceae bacterium]|nr:hypothetical protein IMSAGC018_01390 [Lachnospiraceae bacterium]
MEWGGGFPIEKICKTVHQYNKDPVSNEDMEKLLDIARDYRKVKNYVYERFGGIGSISKLYPGYTVQNEMTKTGLRETLGMPSVYFYLAVFDALGDIKCQWTKTKSEILKIVGQKEEFTEEEKHYLRFLLKVNNAFEAVLNRKPVLLKRELQGQYNLLAEKVDVRKLKNYLCRQVRKHYLKLHTDVEEGFSIAERAYRYADHGIYISVKQKRKRIFVSLTDNNRYTTQLYIKLFPDQGRIEIKAPIQVTVHKHEDYTSHIGVAVGMYTMFTTDEGRRYGEGLGGYQTKYADWLRKQTGSYMHNKSDNPGRLKYRNKKRRYEEALHAYINQELNRFLRTEKPEVIYIPKLPGPKAGGGNKRMNHYNTLWHRGYIRRRLTQKCREQSVEIVEVMGKDISRECSCCGGEGEKKGGTFVCPVCGYQAEEKVNAAINAKKRGQGNQRIY